MSKAYNKVCPCKNCTKRNATCHSSCEDYKEWKKTGVEIENKPFIRFIDFSKLKKK